MKESTGPGIMKKDSSATSLTVVHACSPSEAFRVFLKAQNLDLHVRVSTSGAGSRNFNKLPWDFFLRFEIENYQSKDSE